MTRLLIAILIAGNAAAQTQPQRAANAPAALPDAQHVLAFLNRTLAWSDRVDEQAQLADEPTDILYVNDNRQIARQVVTLSFEAAKAEAQLMTNAAVAASANATSDRAQRMAKRATSAAETLRREQARLADLQNQLASATEADRARLQAAVAEAQSRVAMAQTRNDTLSGIVGFLNNGGQGADLPSQIAALEQSAAATHTAALPAAERKEPPSSVVGLITDLIDLNQKSNALQSAIRLTGMLERDSRELQAPVQTLLAQMRQRTDALMSAPESSDPAELLRRGAELDAATARFRQLSAAMMPLAKRRVLLDAYKANLSRWKTSVAEAHRRDLRRLMFRGIAFGIMLLLVIAVAVIWRRITFRYVQDVKRRHHFLLIRRIVLLLLVAALLTATFASDFGQLTTFFGLLTAGIAIALQDVILSMAGYFVIIGKYGIRPGDRVRIAAVNGDVLDVGLVWIYLMELEARGTDMLPTGRIVEFPNSVVFDHAAGIFKQLPGTRFLWHEVAITVPPSTDFEAMQASMLAGVEKVFAQYSDDIQRQHREMDRLLGTTTPPPRPHSRLRVAPTGVEIRVRYPVEIADAGDIDDRVAAAVTQATSTRS